MASKLKLKECPFCGSPGEIEPGDDGGFRATCTNGECPTLPGTLVYWNKAAAAAKWNTRAKKRRKNT